MAIIYVTKETIEKSRKYGVHINVQELVTNCQTRSFSEAFQLFDIRHPYLYKRISNYRLIAKVESIKETEVICILDILKKGDKESNDFNADHYKFGHEKLEKLLDRPQVEIYVSQEIQKGLELGDTKKKQLPEDLFRWLEPFEHIQNTDDLILESHQWVSKFQSKEYEKFWANYYNLVKNALYNQNDQPLSENSKVFYIKDNASGRSIVYARFLLDDNQATSESVIFLLDAVKPSESPHIEEKLKEYQWVNEKEEILKNIDAIAPFAARSYLSLVLADEELWYQTETNDAANPALSAEELALLSRVRHAPLSDPVLPIFINGRAGSGKSTMLYHLFSDYLHRKATLNLGGDLLFLTYSDSLLKTAKENVRKLMTARADLNITSKTKYVEDKLPKFDEYFRPFLDFIKNHVPREILIKNFPEDKYIDFSRFKKVFGKYTPNNRLSPDLCWHVIRTFIKGHSISSYLSPDEYDDLPQKEKSVSNEIYSQVYRTVWETYKESEYWDTQDLVRKIIEEGWIYPKYSVVFCDESQDFTRVELEFILKLLIYQDYDLGWTKYIRLPFALAGDPFQTLNPTGFRWEAIKASFYDEVVGNLDPYGRGNIEFDYKELAYNYRSQAPIVRLSNLFQLWREAFFGTSDVYPQKPWRDDEYVIPPRLYILNENISEDAFFIMAENSVIILPCEQGQEKEFVESDLLLSALSKRNNYPTFQSPMTAKGLEYSRVILYGFGDACPEKFFTSSTSEIHLENEYFLNKLYVAATRAMKSLIIVDTKTGKEKLWKFTLGQNHIQPLIKKSRNPQKWETERVSGVTSGDYYDPQMEQVTQDPLEIARKLEEAGQSNPELLRQAMDFYNRAGEEAKARHCEAKSFEAEGKYKQAGDSFSNQGRHEDAERCYWKGECWKELNIWYLQHEGGVEIHQVVAAFMAGDGRDKSVVDKFINHMLQLLRDEMPLPVEQPQFQKAVDKISKLFSKPDNAQPDELRRFINLVKLSPSLQYIIGFEESAILLFNAEEFQFAVNLWDKSNKPDNSNYEYAKAMLANDINEKVYWLNLSKKHEMIINIYEASDKASLEKDTLRVIADSYRQSSRHENALTVLWQIGEYEKALEVFRKLTSKLSVDDLEKIFTEKFKTLLANNQTELAYEWYKEVEKQFTIDSRTEYAGLFVAKLLQHNRWGDAAQLLKQGRAKKSINIAGNDSLKIHKQIVEEIATSEKILNASSKEKIELAKYLVELNARGYSEWANWVSIETMGSAIEKTSTFIETLAFYENLEKEQLLSEQVTFIRQRWLKVKNKQLDKLKTDINLTESRESEKLARTFTNRKKELDERLSTWKYDLKSISSLSDYPIASKKDEMSILEDIQIEWQSPVCRISIRKDIQILADVLKGSLISFPVDAINNKLQNEKIVFHSKNHPLSGEIIQGKLIRIYINGKLQQEYNV